MDSGDVIQNTIHIHTKEKWNGVRKDGGCDSKHDTYHLPAKEKRNGVRKNGRCDSKHDITYILRKKIMESLSVEDVIQNTISLTYLTKRP